MYQEFHAFCQLLFCTVKEILEKTKDFDAREFDAIEEIKKNF
jgi:hypothetical protein